MRNKEAHSKLQELSGNFLAVQKAMFKIIKKNPLDIGMLILSMHIMMVRTSMKTLEIIPKRKEDYTHAIEGVKKSTNAYKKIREGMKG